MDLWEGLEWTICGIMFKSYKKWKLRCWWKCGEFIHVEWSDFSVWGFVSINKMFLENFHKCHWTLWNFKFKDNGQNDPVKFMNTPTHSNTQPFHTPLSHFASSLSLPLTPISSPMAKKTPKLSSTTIFGEAQPPVTISFTGFPLYEVRIENPISSSWILHFRNPRKLGYVNLVIWSGIYVLRLFLGVLESGLRLKWLEKREYWCCSCLGNFQKKLCISKKLEINLILGVLESF